MQHYHKYLNEEKEDSQDILKQQYLKIMKHALDPDEDFDEQQLKKGIKIEKEHFDDLDLAKGIAKAHLKEHPKYYDYLEKMETSWDEEE